VSFRVMRVDRLPMQRKGRSTCITRNDTKRTRILPRPAAFWSPLDVNCELNQSFLECAPDLRELTTVVARHMFLKSERSLRTDNLPNSSSRQN
jgi:hypothetical protein